MYPSVKEVVPGDDYILSVAFENGENGHLDMKPILDFGIFQRIKDYDAFRLTQLSGIVGLISIRNMSTQNVVRANRHNTNRTDTIKRTSVIRFNRFIARDSGMT